MKSALHASLETKKDQSYYYAHQPRGTREAPAPPPVHQALRKDKLVREPTVESISLYQFLDGEKHPKVFIPLQNVGQISDASITADFKKASFSIDIQDYKPNTILRLCVSNLEGEIDPEGCKFKKAENKITVQLAKLPNEDGRCFPWRNLKR